MKAAVVTVAGQPPQFMEFADPPAGDGVQRVRVSAAALSQLTRARAAGAHYSSGDALPLVPGVDGTGVLEDGRRVYFVMPVAPFGAMAQFAPVAEEHWIALPDGVDDATAAALANPGMSAWAALRERARFERGETVLVHGANGAAGRMAIQIARFLGAERVVATARRAESFDALRALGADHCVLLAQDEASLEAEFRAQFRRGVDVVLDYVWGPVTRTLLVAAARTLQDGVPLRHVQVGSLGGAELALPAQVLRASALELMGSGIGSVPVERLLASIQALLQAAPKAGFRMDIRRMPLSQVALAWASPDQGARIVLEP